MNLTPSGVFNAFPKNASKETFQGCLLHNYFSTDCTIAQSSVVEYCLFEGSVSIGKNSIVSSCHYADDKLVLEIPPNALLHTIPLKLSSGHLGYTTIVFHCEENIKKKAKNADDAKDIWYLNSDLRMSRIAKARNAADIAAMFSQTGNNIAYTLWNAKLFPVLSSAHESLVSAVRIFKHAMESGEFEAVGTSLWVSMADILSMKDVHQMVQMRSGLYDRIAAK
jgi:fucose-1-phosphate guanylyltransferase